MKQVVDELRWVLPPEALVTDPDRRYRYDRARAGEPLARETAQTALKQLSTTIAHICVPMVIAVHRAIQAPMDPDSILKPGTVAALGDL